MNFQRLIGILTKSQDDTMFEDIVGCDHIKRLFKMALESDSTTHILLSCPPATEDNVSYVIIAASEECIFY